MTVQENMDIQKVYVLLVGIDNYPNVRPLRGCINDVRAWANYLQERHTADDTLHLKVLIDEQATRNAVIDGFRTHLINAGASDRVLVVFCGHGSQQAVPREFRAIEPDRMNETLVCWDSRLEGSWDLADKELGKLIAEVAQKKPQITIVLDCCHSGSGVREIVERGSDYIEIIDSNPRYIEPNYAQRPADSYLVSAPTAPPFTKDSLATNRELTQFKWPNGPHTLLAACRNDEKAKECKINGKSHGIFSHFLLEALRQTTQSLTHQDLFKRTEALVKRFVSSQSPQLESIYGDSIDRYFLGDAIATRSPYYIITCDMFYGWVMNGGQLHGLPNITEPDTIHLAVFPYDSQPDELLVQENALGTAKVATVLANQSQIEMQGIDNLNEQMTFKAIVTSQPQPSLGVIFEGDTAGLDLVRGVLNASQPSIQQGARYVYEVADSTNARFRLIAQEQQYVIAKNPDDLQHPEFRPIGTPVMEYTKSSAEMIVEALEHVARWQLLAELTNPTFSALPNDAVKLEIYEITAQEEKGKEDCPPSAEISLPGGHPSSTPS